MKVKISLFIFALFSCNCFSQDTSNFEKALAGFQDCEFSNLNTNKVTRLPKNEYLAKHNIMPYKGKNWSFFYKLNETYYGLPVSELVISTDDEMSINGIYIDAESEKVTKELKAHFPNGFYSFEEWEKMKIKPTQRKPILKKLSKNRVLLSCGDTFY